MKYKTRSILAGLVAAAFIAAPASAQQKVKIGFITTLSGPQGVIGEDMRNSVELALDHLKRKVGGLDVEMIYGDDQVKPDVGKQVAEEMLKKHQMMPETKFTWCFLSISSATCLPTSGLTWSSP